MHQRLYDAKKIIRLQRHKKKSVSLKLLFYLKDWTNLTTE